MRLYQDCPAGTVDRARSLRRAASPLERRLLRGLREAFPHLKWRHQAPIGPFYADVLCFSERLVIELDGDSHAEAESYDAARTSLIEREGFRVIRFINGDVAGNLEAVLAAIANDLGSPSPPHATRLPPLPTGEGKNGRRPRGGEGGHPNEKDGVA